MNLTRGRSARAIAAAVAVGVAATVVVVGQTGSDANAHDGVVSGTVWVANEESDSLTAIDAAKPPAATVRLELEHKENAQEEPR